MKLSAFVPLLLAVLTASPAWAREEERVSIGDVLTETGKTLPWKEFKKTKEKPVAVVFYADNTGQHGWALSLVDHGNLTWGHDSIDVPTIRNMRVDEALADFDGGGNTKNILALNGHFPAAQAVNINSGWYLPSAGQLRKLAGERNKVNRTLKRLQDKDKSILLWEEIAYWSSTETYDGGAWYVVGSGAVSIFFGGGYEKSRMYRVRSVRSF